MKATNKQTAKADKTFDKFFTASCDHFGFIEGIYRDVDIKEKDYTVVMHPFEYNFIRAIDALHSFIIDQNMVNEFPKAKFEIQLVDGNIDKNGEIKLTPVYSISSAKAKKLLL